MFVGGIPFGHEADLRAFNISLSQGIMPPSAGPLYSQTPGLPPTGLHPLLASTVSGLPLTQPGLLQAGLPPFQHHSLLTGQTPIIPATNQKNFSSMISPPVVTVVDTVTNTQNMFPTTGINIVTPKPSHSFLPQLATFSSTTTSRTAPVNVVITSSSPLPSITTMKSQPILSVTIPSQHLKGTSTSQVEVPHNYQIQLPTTSVSSSSEQNLFSQCFPTAVQNLQTPTVEKSVDLGSVIEKSLSQSFNPSISNLKTFNKSNISIEEPDPLPNFQPIIPLPDEVPVTTGEEGELVLFQEHAKLYRYVQRQWRERGVGVLKLLKNSETGKVRILMRRDAVHKICANHFLSNDMKITPKSNCDNTYIWVANDFADEEIVLETFCAKFKTGEEAHRFYLAFEASKKDLSNIEPVNAKGEREFEIKKVCWKKCTRHFNRLD